MPDDKKKYPWIKSIFGRKKESPVECVYAGPEVMKQRAGRTDEVYAGPPPKVDMPVYAGPEVMKQRAGWTDDPVPHCPFCGVPLPEGVKACPECGAAVPESDPQAESGGGTEKA